MKKTAFLNSAFCVLTSSAGVCGFVVRNLVSTPDSDGAPRLGAVSHGLGRPLQIRSHPALRALFSRCGGGAPPRGPPPSTKRGEDDWGRSGRELFDRAG